MKIAVFHNFMDNIGGAEIVTLTLVRELQADLYTTNIDPEKIRKMGYEDVLSRIISIGKIPTNAPFRHQSVFRKFRKLNLGNKYDFYIISGDWAMSGAVNNEPNLWYVHSPLNELWQFKDYIKNELLSWWKKPIFDIWVWLNRKLSLRYSKSVNIWVCNSENTKTRIKKFYKKDAVVINPPIKIPSNPTSTTKNYWLSVNRLITHKRIELQMEAFAKLPNEKLIIVGSYEKGARQFESYKKYIESIQPDNVEIIHWADQATLDKLYSGCKGFITTAKDEDFGMTPVEAMAHGKPVIAPNEGGYKESIVDGETGILIDEINTEKLVESIKKISLELEHNPSKYKDACLARASKYSTAEFMRKIKSAIA